MHPQMIEAHRKAIAANHLHYALWSSANGFRRLTDTLNQTAEAFNTLKDSLDALGDLEEDDDHDTTTQ